MPRMKPSRGPVSDRDRSIGLYLRDCWPETTPVFGWLNSLIGFDGWHELRMLAVLTRDECEAVMADWAFAYEDLSSDPEISSDDAAGGAWRFARDSYLFTVNRAFYDTVVVFA